MSNGARHGLGVLIGLVVTPLLLVGLSYGAEKMRFVVNAYARRFQDYHGRELWIALAVMLAAAIMIGLVSGSRLSPLASLIPGSILTIIGFIWMMWPRWAMAHPGSGALPNQFEIGYITLGPFGIFFVIGMALVVASVAPSRWRARTAAGAAPRYGAPPPAPMGPPPMYGAPAPMGAPQPPQPPQAPQAPPAPGQSPPAWQGGAQYGQAPAQPGASNPPPLPPASPASPSAQDKPKSSSSSGPDDDEPGDWTRMYGGNR